MASQENDWIKWAGGECPVPAKTIVDVRHADDTISFSVEAGDARDDDPRYGFDWWKHEDTLSNGHGFIKAYRLAVSA